MQTNTLTPVLLALGIGAAAVAQSPARPAPDPATRPPAAADAAAGRSTAPGPDDPAWRPHRQLRVLYAGHAGGSRERAFAAFLGRWFDATGTLPLEQLSMQTAADFDVVVVDWVSQYGNDGYPVRDDMLSSAPADLGPGFTKPFVTMSYVGANVRPKHKLDWL